MNTNIEVSLHPLLSTIPDIQRTHTLKSTYYLVNYGQNHAQADNLPCLQLWTDCIGVVCTLLSPPTPFPDILLSYTTA